MKSAYEIAMERLNQESGPAKKLSEEQRALIAEIDAKYDAKIAGIKVNIEPRLATAESLEQLNELKAQLAQEIQSFEEKREREKEQVWGEEG